MTEILGSLKNIIIKIMTEFAKNRKNLATGIFEYLNAKVNARY